MWWILLIILLLISLLFVWKMHPVRMIRFSKPTCKYCVDSQLEWDKFKSLAKLHNIETIDVDISDNTNHTKYWLSKYKIDSVPTVIKITTLWSYVYDGPRICGEYMKFAME